MSKNFNILRRLKIWHKVALIAACMSVPIPFITYLLVVEKNKSIETSGLELSGVQYMQPLKGMARDLSRYRDLSNAFLRGATATRSQVAEAERLVDANFAAAEEIDQKLNPAIGKTYGAVFEITNQVRAAKRKWEALKGRAYNAQPDEFFAEQTQLISEILDLIKQVAAKAHLVLDQDIDTYYLISAAVDQVPQAVENIGQLRGLGSGITAAKAITQGELVQIISQLRQTQRSIRAFQQSMNQAYLSNAELKQKHGDLVEIAVREADSFINFTDQRLVRAKIIDPAPTEFFAAGTRAADRLLKVDELVRNDLESLLNARISRLGVDRIRVIGLILVGVMLTVLGCFLIARGITRQIDVISRLISNIERGNLETRAESFSEDELGKMAKAFNNMLDSTSGLIQSREERDHIQQAIIKLLDDVSGVAEGDLTREAQVTADITGAIADAFNFMIAELRRLISQVQEVTEQVTSTASQTQAATEQLAYGSQEQAAQITSTSEALGDMTVSIQKVSEDAVSSAAVADQALSSARKGARIVQDTMKGMARIQEQVQETSRHIRQLGERSQEISEIVRLIDEIADRTGVLALNASIQASAAGEAGQGFSVVATEVEQLAKRSTTATKKISNLVHAIQSGINEAIGAMDSTAREVVSGTKLAHQAEHSLGEIETVSRRLAELIQLISLTSIEHARGSEAISRFMAEIAASTQQTASGVMQSAATVKNLAELASDLRTSVASFRLPREYGHFGGKGSNNGSAWTGAK
ncbi:MAG TPA: methyl-accepting chemotaxis protein [Blastocatellia bacterium]|nr:methyl-accepting chemotaxis protein [Blastocatellia bacterium]